MARFPGVPVDEAPTPRFPGVPVDDAPPVEGGIGRGLSRIGFSVADLLGDVAGNFSGRGEAISNLATQAAGLPTPPASQVNGAAFRRFIADTFGVQDANADFERFASQPSGPATPPLQVRDKVGTLPAVGQGIVAGLADVAGLASDTVTAVPRILSNALVKPFTGEPQEPVFQAGDVFRQSLGDLAFQNIGQVNPNDRPAAAFGQVVGGSAPLVGPLRALQATRAPVKAFRALQELPAGSQSLVKTVAPASRQLEAASITGAGLGAATAELADPGDPITSLVSQVIGSVLSPTALAARSAGAGAVTGLKDTAKRFVSDSARLDRASKVVRQNIVNAGEDPDEVAKLLRASDSSVPFTADVESNSSGFANLRRFLAKQDAGLEAQFAKQNDDAMASLVATADRLATSPSPDGLKAAGALYRKAFLDTFTAARDRAVSKATEAAKRLGSDPAAQHAEAGRLLAAAENEAFRAGRQFESSVWKSIDKSAPVPVEAVSATLADARANVLPGRSVLDDVAERFIDDIAEKGESTAGDLLRLRSDALSMARQKAAAGDANGARLAGNIAASALDDLASVPGTEVARQISREFNEAFTQTFAGDIRATARTGEERIAPELTAAKALAGGSGGAQRLVRGRELRDAAGFDPRASGADLGDIPGLPTAEETAAAATSRRGTAQSALEQGRTAQLAETVDPATSRVSAKRLEKKLVETQSADLPESQSIGEQAVKAEKKAAKAESVFADREKRLTSPSESTLARLAERDGKSTREIVSAALKRNDRGREFERLAAVAKNKRLSVSDRKAAAEDLRAGAFDAVLTGATSGKGAVSFIDLQKSLLGQSRGQRSVLELMQRTGVADPDHAQAITALVRRGAQAEKSLLETGVRSAELDSPSKVFEFLQRVAGSKLGGAVAKVGGEGNSLIAQSAGSQLVRSLAKKLPQVKIQDLLAHALEDKEFAALLIERSSGKFTLARRRRFSKVTAGLVQAGLLPKDAFEELEREADKQEGR